METQTPAPSSPAFPTPPSVEEVIQLIEHWPLADRARVLEAVSRSVREEVSPAPMTTPMNIAAPDDGADDAAWQAERARLLADVPPESSAHRLLGAFRGNGPIPMTPDEERAVLEEMLVAKYGK